MANKYKMLNITSHGEIQTKTIIIEHHITTKIVNNNKKKKTMLSVGKNVEKLKYSYIASIM